MFHPLYYKQFPCAKLFCDGGKYCPSYHSIEENTLSNKKFYERYGKNRIELMKRPIYQKDIERYKKNVIEQSEKNTEILKSIWGSDFSNENKSDPNLKNSIIKFELVDQNKSEFKIW